MMMNDDEFGMVAMVRLRCIVGSCGCIITEALQNRSCGCCRIRRKSREVRQMGRRPRTWNFRLHFRMNVDGGSCCLRWRKKDGRSR